jgi:hypothetical protein
MGTGYCAQMCMEDSDCTDTPGSGTATASCGFGNCALECSDEATCPDDMECMMFGGGGGGGPSIGFCVR